MHMLLDVDIDVYIVFVREKFTIALDLTLNLDGTLDTSYFIQSGRKTLTNTNI
jgi:hypothetical protein